MDLQAPDFSSDTCVHVVSSLPVPLHLSFFGETQLAVCAILSVPSVRKYRHTKVRSAGHNASRYVLRVLMLEDDGHEYGLSPHQGPGECHISLSQLVDELRIRRKWRDVARRLSPSPNVTIVPQTLVFSAMML